MTFKATQIFVLIACLVVAITSCGIRQAEANTGTLLGPASTTVTIELDNLDPELIAQVMKARKLAEAAKTNVSEVKTVAKNIQEVSEVLDPGEIEAWSNAIGAVVKSLADAIGVTVNDFLATPAGIGIAAIIVWKAGGPYLINTIVDFTVGIFSWCIFSLIFIWVFQRLYFARNKITITNQQGNTEVSYEPRTVWVDKHNVYDPSTKFGSMTIIAVLYVVVSIVCLGTIIW